mmetsp:Transcript_6290/g.15871  ORF Transcript_6290/g.15871 Transcript_6290/m.15871 type:complete len:204 (-) Transcript_6290:72-683(-)
MRWWMVIVCSAKSCARGGFGSMSYLNPLEECHRPLVAEERTRLKFPLRLHPNLDDLDRVGQIHCDQRRRARECHGSKRPWLDTLLLLHLDGRVAVYLRRVFAAQRGRRMHGSVHSLQAHLDRVARWAAVWCVTRSGAVAGEQTHEYFVGHSSFGHELRVSQCRHRFRCHIMFASVNVFVSCCGTPNLMKFQPISSRLAQIPRS